MAEKTPYQLWKEQNPDHPLVFRQNLQNSVPKASEEVQKERMSICRSCENFDHTGHCGLCNCFMEIKTTFEASTCPDNKW